MGPNPRAVRIFMAEKGIELPLEQVDLIAGDNRKDAHLARNPAGQLPTLELDDGSFLAEITVICDYLEEKNPSPPLIGTTAEERAETRMWTRRIDLTIIEPLTNGFRYAEGLGLFKDRVHVIPAAADDLKAIAQEQLAKLDGLIAGKKFICGDRFSYADVHLYAFLEFAQGVGQPLDGKLENLQAWFTRVAARPSIEASKA
jgi:glutathione S-transferase